MVPSISKNTILSFAFALLLWNFFQAYANVAPVMLSFIDDVDGIALESMDNKFLTAPGLVHFPSPFKSTQFRVFFQNFLMFFFMNSKLLNLE